MTFKARIQEYYRNAVQREQEALREAARQRRRERQELQNLRRRQARKMLVKRYGRAPMTVAQWGEYLFHENLIRKHCAAKL